MRRTGSPPLEEGLNFDMPIHKMEKALAEYDRAVTQFALALSVARETSGLMGPAGVVSNSILDKKSARVQTLLKRLRNKIPSTIDKLK